MEDGVRKTSRPKADTPTRTRTPGDTFPGEPGPDIAPRLPPVLAGLGTPESARRAQTFYLSVTEIFERWVQRRSSAHTQRAYRRDVMDFIFFLRRRLLEDGGTGLRWPEDSWKLLQASVADVLGWRDEMEELGRAPKTLNRRISSLSSFYKYLAAAAAELRLPITVPNPAHAQFIARTGSDALRETRALTATRARQLMGLPKGDDVLAARDRAILKVFLYTGIRIGTACRLNVGDFHEDGEEATLKLNEKGNRHRTIGIHFVAAEAIREYTGKAGLDAGPLFRARLNPRSLKLGKRRISPTSMYRLVEGYLRQLPAATKAVREEAEAGAGEEDRRAAVYTPHSLRATTATSGRSRSSSGTGTSRRPRFTTNAGARPRKAPPTTYRFD